MKFITKHIKKFEQFLDEYSSIKPQSKFDKDHRELVNYKSILELTTNETDNEKDLATEFEEYFEKKNNINDQWKRNI